MTTVDKTQIEIPFNRTWVDSRGFMSLAWDELANYPGTTMLYGHIDPDLDPYTKNQAHFLTGGQRQSVKTFTIERDVIKQKFTYMKKVGDDDTVGPRGPGATIPLSAIAIIRRGVIEVHSEMAQTRSRASLLEKWVLTSTIHEEGVVRFVNFKTHGWKLVERCMNVTYPQGSNDYPSDTTEFVVLMVTKSLFVINSRKCPTEEREPLIQNLMERQRRFKRYWRSLLPVTEEIRFMFIELFFRWKAGELTDENYLSQWDVLDNHIFNE